MGLKGRRAAAKEARDCCSCVAVYYGLQGNQVISAFEVHGIWF